GGRGFAPALSAVSFADEMCPCDRGWGEGGRRALCRRNNPALSPVPGARGLRRSSPSFRVMIERASSAPLLDVPGLGVVHRGRGLWPWKTVGRLTAGRDLSFQIAPGETFALVGESGSGKSTVARAVQGLVALRKGRILFEGRDVSQPIARREKHV